MNAEAVLKEQEQVQVLAPKEEVFAKQVSEGKVERYVAEYLQNSEIAKERKDVNEMIKEDVGHILGASGYPTVFELQNGQFGVVKVQEKTSRKLDKDGLANYIGVAKDEMSTPYDFARLIEKGDITAEMIKSFMVEDKKLQVSIRQAKNNPLKKMVKNK